MKENIIGRQEEISRLEKYISSGQSEFVAIYGRRRIGKTYLVRELYEGKFSFRMTAMENVNTKEQLNNFHQSLNNYTRAVETPRDWHHAFYILEQYLEKECKEEKKIIFIDELPWFDTPGARFVAALEHFWNDWAAYRRDIKLVVCGSATTWMLDQVVNSKGGLHNRATHTMLMSPFTLRETELYFRSKGFVYERQEIIDSYMAIGGVAYYLSLFERDKSVVQNIESLCFTRGGELVDEFQKIFRSLYKKADNHIAVITALEKKGMGMTRQEIIKETRMRNNGNFTKLLRELEECDFIRGYIPFKKSKKDMMYQLIDPFILFHFRFMKDGNSFLKGYWQKMQATSVYKNWCGYAFEITCLNHIEQIVHALGIDGTINTPCSWIYRPSKEAASNKDVDEELRHGAQIDLLIDRSDKTINVCEIKYSDHEYEITKDYDAHLSQRLRIFRKVTKTRKSLLPVFITPNGLTDNMYARRLPRQVTGDHLFG